MKEKIFVKNFNYFGGKHCQTGALKNILAYHGIDLSEEMLLGLGGGIGFIYWYMKLMPSPFMGCRGGGKGEKFLLDICRRVGGDARMFKTSSVEKGYEELKKILRQGEPAYVFVDMAYLPYFAIPENAHFGGHSVVVFGLDEIEDKVYISDRARNPVTVKVEEIKRARNSKFPPFPAQNQILKIKYPARIVNLEKGIRNAIRDCCKTMLNPPIKNIGLEGMKKWAGLVMQWPTQFKGLNLLGCLFNVFIYIEIGGTGGSAFRPMYAKFLKESTPIINKPELNVVAEMFEESGKAWSGIARDSLPDSWSSLKRIRELFFEKNTLFERQEPGDFEKMLEINKEMDGLAKKSAEAMEKNDTALLLSNLQKKILDCYKIEENAFKKLNEIIK